MGLLWLASAHTLLGMRCAHPDEFVLQRRPDDTSIHHVRPKREVRYELPAAMA